MTQHSYRVSRLLCVIACWAYSTPQIASAQCYSCHDFSAASGYYPSPLPPYEPCPQTNCGNGGPNEPPYSEMLHPGLITEQKGGRLLIAAIVDGSPASVADLKPGDEIVSINGFEPAVSCGAQTWESSKGSKLANITIKRDRLQMAFTLRLEPVGVITANAQRLQTVPGTAVVPASLRPKENIRQSYGPYITGLNWIRQGDHLLVTGVLPGSPAAAAGLLAGDQVTVLNGVKITKASRALVSALSDADHRVEVSLVVLDGDGGSRRELKLRSEGMSQLFSQLARNGERPAINIAQTTTGQ